MQRIFFLLTMFFLTIGANASNQIDEKYLGSAVPEINGNIVFEKKILEDKNYSKDQLYNSVQLWLTNQLKKSQDGLICTILYENRDKYELAARLETKLIFKNEGIILDDAIMNFIIKINVVDHSLNVVIQNIKYDYYDQVFKKDINIKGKWIPSEKIISDAVSMNKEQTRLYKPYDKFRIFTLDYITELFAQIQANFDAVTTQKENTVQEKTMTIEPKKVEYSKIEVTSSPSNKEDIKSLSDKDNLVVIAGNKNEFYIAIPISYSIQKHIDGVYFIEVELDKNSSVNKMMDNNNYTLVWYPDSDELLLSSMSDQKKFDFDTFQKLGLNPIELSNGNIGLKNEKISFIVTFDNKETDMARKKHTNKLTDIFVGKINVND